ncbi:hypothetical protein [Fluviispira multicolorata]|uniref:Uncharacterized protein n=1 Tax=Fluviispira multicolorata TaxID=2654512 RepID=A0A833JFT0_9BACT|nr:hypothetical protein [Fluviispira multicolorata]KAB8033515.1 hypothetical protein GCL57_02080 [Fluviispira multicolorata]
MKFLKSNQRAFHILSYIIICISFIVLFTSCQTSTQHSSKNTLQTLQDKNALNKALVFYASDDPILLRYFSTSFTRRISDDGIYQAIQDRNLNREWMANSSGGKFDVDVEQRLKLYSQNIKEAYLIKHTAKVSFIARNAMKEAKNLLSHNPVSVGLSYAELAFWASIANNSIPHVARSYALIYEKYATFALKDHLESQIDVKIINQLKALTAPYLIKQKTVKILNSNKCAIFVDGQELKSKSIQIPAKMSSVISANCTNGSFAQTFTADNLSAVKIVPYFPTAFYSMPNPDTLPKEQILKERVAAVILIYWSHSGRYMDSIFIEPKTFSIVKKTRIALTTRQDLDQAGDNLMAFLKIASAKIAKNNSVHLTAGN